MTETRHIEFEGEVIKVDYDVHFNQLGQMVWDRIPGSEVVLTHLGQYQTQELGSFSIEMVAV